MEAIEFILSKLNSTKNNTDFFTSMNKPTWYNNQNKEKKLYFKT
jgi:hypothetical protein